MSLSRRFLLLAALAWPLAYAADTTQSREVRLPPGAQGFSLGGTISANGMPMQVQGFLSKQSAVEVIAWFRASLGMPLVENHVGTGMVLGRAQGTEFLTVQIAPAGSGSRGLIAQTDLPAMVAGREEERSLQARWLSRLPSGMRLQSLTRGHDAGRHYQYLVLDSPHSSSLTRNAISNLMQQDGYALEREVRTIAPPSQTLYFRGAARESTAVILAHADGSSAVVLNTILTIDGAR
ncbi:hypothetical protein [Noviherbaspirillum soli]|uniref:hypothetical protein n=1 Tax=Noviherbaspirillum soli TaxID=1064518 RepID=UPI00188A5D3F|nr:hypothetical protein [Noviherbaspirillum soli]